MPRIKCSGCGNFTQIQGHWAREGRSFTLLYKALALSEFQDLLVRQAPDNCAAATDKSVDAWSIT